MSDTPAMPTMDRDGYVAQVTILASIVGEYKEAKGTASQRRNLATLEALGQIVPWDEASGIPASPVEGDTLADLAVYVDKLNTWADGLRDSMVGTVLKASTQSADEVAALKERYDAQRNLVTSLATVLGAMGVDVTDVEVPVLRSGGGGGKRASGSKFQQFYLVKNGVRKDKPDSTNQYSTFAFHYAAKITGTDPSGSHTDHLTKYLEANVDNNGGKFSLGKPWAVTVDGITYGMDVTSADDTDDEAADEATDTDD